MKTVTPIKPNYDMLNFDDKLKVEIHTNRLDVFTKAMTVVSFIFWILLGVLSAIIINMPGNKNTTILLSAMWITLGVTIVAGLIFRLTFYETIEINQETIIVEYKSWLFKKYSRQFLASYIQGLRSSPLPPVTIWSGRIVFDYGGKTYNFGSKLTESEAQQILSAIKTKFANYDLAKW